MRADISVDRDNMIHLPTYHWLLFLFMFRGLKKTSAGRTEQKRALFAAF